MNLASQKNLRAWAAPWHGGRICLRLGPLAYDMSRGEALYVARQLVAAVDRRDEAAGDVDDDAVAQ